MSDGQNHPQATSEHAVQPAPQEAPAKPLNILEAIDAMIGPLLFCVARGAIALLVHVPAQVVLISLCRVLGKLMGDLYIGDEIAVRAFRHECRQAFRVAIIDAPIQAAPKAATPAQTAVKVGS